MPTCIYTKRQFDKASAEHILQNALGATRTSDQIACDEVQVAFAKGIDLAVAEEMNPFRNLIGGLTGRKRFAPPIKGVKGSNGAEYELNHGGVPFLLKPHIMSVSESSDGTVKDIHIMVRDPSEVPRAEAMVRKMFPGFSKMVVGADLQQVADRSTYHFQLRLAGRDFARGILKSCFNLIGLCDHALAITEPFDPVREFVYGDKGDLKDFFNFYCPSTHFDLPEFGDFSHCIAIYPSSGNLCAYTRFWGEVAFLFRLASNYSGAFKKAYVIDPLRKHKPPEALFDDFDYSSLPVFVEHENTQSMAHQAMAAMQEEVERFMGKWRRKCMNDTVLGIFDDVFTNSKSECITSEMVGEFSERVAHALVGR